MNKSLLKALSLIEQKNYFEVEVLLDELIDSEDKNERALANYFMYVACKAMGKDNSSRNYLAKFFQHSINFQLKSNGYVGEFNVDADNFKSEQPTLWLQHQIEINQVHIQNSLIWLLTNLLTDKLLK